jgi:N-acetylglucosamine-6-phosphate deacetylase
VLEKGRIAPGADADLVVLGQNGKIEETIVAGTTIGARQEDE